MAIAIDATPNGPSANSYGTLAEALAYFATRLGGNLFIDADVEVQKQILITGTSHIDQELYRGQRATATQALQWGRSGTYLSGRAIDQNIIPAFVKFASFEQGLALYKRAGVDGLKDPLGPTGTEGLKSLDAGSVSLVFRDSDRTQDNARAADDPSRSLAPAAYRLLRLYILTDAIGANPGVRTFPIIR